MANFNGTARSNYFRVKDEAAFRAWAAKLPNVIVLTDGPGEFGLASECPDTGTWPSYIELESEDGETTESEELDWKDQLGPLLADGSVVVLMEAGAERLRYINGWAMAFDNSDKPAVQVCLNDIYALAEQAFGATPTDASY